MNTIHLQKDELIMILDFTNKYPTVEFVTIQSDDAAGIGTVVDASVTTVVNGDLVTVTKHIVNEGTF